MGVDYKCTVCQRNIYSTQMLQTRIFIFHQCQYNHGTVFRAIHHDSRKGGEQNGRGMREGGLECVVERMTKTGKMSWGNRRD